MTLTQIAHLASPGARWPAGHARSILRRKLEGTMTTLIQPIETEEHWVVIDSHEIRHGPFASADEAEAMAARFAAVCRLLHGDWPAAVKRRA
jgi:hypothetical protein